MHATIYEESIKMSKHLSVDNSNQMIIYTLPRNKIIYYSSKSGNS